MKKMLTMSFLGKGDLPLQTACLKCEHCKELREML